MVFRGLGFRRVLTILRIGGDGLLCLDCAGNVVRAEHPLSFCEFGMLVYAEWKVPVCQLPVKALGTESLVSFPGSNISHMLL